MTGQPCDLCGAKWLRDEDAELCCWDFKAGFKVIHGRAVRQQFSPEADKEGCCCEGQTKAHCGECYDCRTEAFCQDAARAVFRIEGGARPRN